jgi:hypothetical protein
VKVKKVPIDRRTHRGGIIASIGCAVALWFFDWLAEAAHLGRTASSIVMTVGVSATALALMPSGEVNADASGDRAGRDEPPEGRSDPA